MEEKELEEGKLPPIYVWGKDLSEYQPMRERFGFEGPPFIKKEKPSVPIEPEPLPEKVQPPKKLLEPSPEKKLIWPKPFPWWILGVILVGGCMYGLYRGKKKEEEERYPWQKKLPLPK